ncbi:hypothetical protein SAMN05216207_106215 [Pseudonocardia ammonioxydans]|uniref:PH domain-containing protein n=1 Tax=Pseudonocardia ammonioxydans TaxID=260086 RepID=A0A1I5HCK4_PSUAM|nr:hypothetical protein [Pseudonocardia ammonioxydans]SFO46012.1 hypothetical protein SAMN05216207_106215 [Pseudonocardia ammonioxydans]
MREWTYPLLFVVMTALSVVVLVMGEVGIGGAGVALFGAGGVAYVVLTRDRSRPAERSGSSGGTRHGTLPGLNRYTAATGGLVFVQSTVAVGAGLLGSAGFVVAGLVMVTVPAPMVALGGVLAVAFFGMTLVVCATALLRRIGIVLVPDGVYLRTPAGSAWVRWEDLARVQVADGVRFVAASPERTVLTGLDRALHGINRRRFGMDVAFPGRFLRSSDDVVVETISGVLRDPASRPALADPAHRDAR